MLLAVAHKALKKNKSKREEEAQESAQRNATPTPKPRESGPMARSTPRETWTEQVARSARPAEFMDFTHTWDGRPRSTAEQQRLRHKSLLTRINHDVRCGSLPRLNRLRSNCRRCREIFPR